MLPGILNQLGAESLANLQKLATNVTSAGQYCRALFYIYNRQKILKTAGHIDPQSVYHGICAYVHTKEQPAK